jgi:GNAT superfamily N-acetyltransferase
MVTVRPYQSGDIEALYHICLVTGDAGKDASPLHSDGQLVGHIYSAPYGVIEPEHVFVAEDDAGVAGYVVGAFDTNAFAQRLERKWWPALRARYADAKGLTEGDRGRVATIMRPSQAPADIVAEYPAHIHMNLLERLRGQKVGTRLLNQWVETAKAGGVEAIHLGASAANTGGCAFWQAGGFTPIRTEGGTVWFGMKL